VTAVFAFDSGITVMQIATLQIPVNDLLQIGAPETAKPFEAIVIDSEEGLKTSWLGFTLPSSRQQGKETFNTDDPGILRIFLEDIAFIDNLDAQCWRNEPFLTIF